MVPKVDYSGTDTKIGGEHKTGNIHSDSQMFVNSAQRLVSAYKEYSNFVGSAYEKHLLLLKWHQVISWSLKNPTSVLYPKTAWA